MPGSGVKKQMTKFISYKEPTLKEEINIKYKIYKNLLSTLMKKSKQTYYNKCYETNWNYIKIS